jgi:hypothetical protein
MTRALRKGYRVDRRKIFYGMSVTLGGKVRHNDKTKLV